REACHAGVRDGADRRGEPEREGFAVEFSEERARLDPRQLRDRIDLDGAHSREVDDEAAVATRLTRHAVTARAHRGEEAPGAAEAHRAPHVRRTRAAHDERGMAIERRVPEPAGARVVGMGDSDELTAQPRTQVLDVGGLESQLPAIEPDGGQRPGAVHSRSARPPSVTRLWHTDTRLERLAPFVAGARLMIDDTGARVGDLARSKGAAR